MSKKQQMGITLSIYIILLLLTLPGFYLIAKEQSSNRIIIVLIFSQLFIVLSISIAIKNIILSLIIDIFSNELNSLSYDIIGRKNLSIKAIQSLSKFYIILIILIGYCLVYNFMPIQYSIIYSSMFIAVYNLSVNIVPNKLLFFNKHCIMHNKINNTFLYVDSYSIEDSKCTLQLSDNSKYHIIVRNSDIDNLYRLFINIKQIS